MMYARQKGKKRERKKEKEKSQEREKRKREKPEKGKKIQNEWSRRGGRWVDPVGLVLGGSFRGDEPG